MFEEKPVFEEKSDSTHNKELLSNVDAGTAADTKSLLRLASHRFGLGFARNRAVAGKTIHYPESTGFLAELEVHLGDRSARIEHSNELIEVFTGLGSRISPDEPAAIDGEALSGAELQNESFARAAGARNAGGLEIDGIVERQGRNRAGLRGRPGRRRQRRHKIGGENRRSARRHRGRLDDRGSIRLLRSGEIWQPIHEWCRLRSRCRRTRRRQLNDGGVTGTAEVLACGAGDEAALSAENIIL